MTKNRKKFNVKTLISNPSILSTPNIISKAPSS